MWQRPPAPRPLLRPPAPPPYPGASLDLSKCLTQIQELEAEKKKLVQDNAELRDLCCFLDDDRQRARKLAKEWQKFGRYTAKVMRQEVATYQQKLQQLDGRQQELVRDNYELKDLCLYLDEERNCIDLNCPHCGEKILSRPNSVVPPDLEVDPDRFKVNSPASSGNMSISSGGSSSVEDGKSKDVLDIYHTAIEDGDTTDTQKAIIQEMCNVVWKVLDKKK